MTEEISTQMRFVHPSPREPSAPPLPRVAAAALRRNGLAAVLLVWHDIVPVKKQVWFDTTVREFAAQMDRLTRAGARPVSLDTLYAALSGNPGAVLPPGAVVLCFDDNTRGIFDFAYPWLLRRGWPFVVSAHTAFVGVRTGKQHNTWDQLRQMERDQVARVVSQTHTHPPDLRILSDAALAREMTTSKILMDAQFGRPTRFVTYPSGKWDRRVAGAAFAAGYRLGLTEDHGPAETSPHLLGLHRYSTHRRFEEALSAIARAARKG